MGLTLKPSHKFMSKKLILKSYLLFALALIVLAGWAGFISRNDSIHAITSPRPDAKTVLAGISWNDAVIQITNEDSRDWPVLSLYLNGMPPFTYHAAIRPLKAGEKIRIPLSAFADDSGRRFKPADLQVTEVWIGGSGFDYEKYGR